MDAGGGGRVLADLRGSFRAAVFSADADGERLLTTSDDDTASLWNAVTGALQTVLHGHDGPINAAVFSPDGSLVATASDDGTARTWSSESGRSLMRLPHEGKVEIGGVLCGRQAGADSILGQNSARLERRRWRAACSPPRSRGINRPAQRHRLPVWRSGLFCRSCEAARRPRCAGLSASFARNSSIRRDLPMPGSPTIWTN